MIKFKKVYLGDGVYATWNEARQIVLTAENGLYAHDTIYLEPEVMAGLINFSDQGPVWKEEPDEPPKKDEEGAEFLLPTLNRPS